MSLSERLWKMVGVVDLENVAAAEAWVDLCSDGHVTYRSSVVAEVLLLTLLIASRSSTTLVRTILGQHIH